MFDKRLINFIIKNKIKIIYKFNYFNNYIKRKWVKITHQ